MNNKNSECCFKCSIIVWLHLLLIISCVKTEDMPVEQEVVPELVVNCVLRNDLPVKILISSTKPAYQKFEQTMINDAEVEIYEGDSLIGHPVLADSGEYRLDYFPKAGMTYKLKVFHRDFPPVEAETTLLMPDTVEVSMQEDSAERTIWVNVSTPAHMQLHYYGFTFVDSTLYENSYDDYKSYSISINVGDLPQDPTIDFVAKPSVSFRSSGVNYPELDIFTGKDFLMYYTLFIPNSEGNSSGEVIFYSNTRFRGFSYNMQIEFYFTNVGKLMIYRLSEDLYKILKSIAANEKTTQTGIFDGISNIVPVLTNVKGGYGYFGSATRCVVIYKNK